jgi:uncharacterized membrane protein YphA (DoxX/SURF4 family)
MRHVTLIARMLFGLAFAVFGLNGVLMSVFDKAFMPPPKEMPEAAASFFQALTNTRFMLPLIGGVQLVSGLMILTGVLTPLGLTLLAPIVVNIVLYHHYVDPNGLGIAYVVLALELFLAYAYWPAFLGVLDPRAKSRWSKYKAGSPGEGQAR